MALLVVVRCKKIVLSRNWMGAMNRFVRSLCLTLSAIATLSAMPAYADPDLTSATASQEASSNQKTAIASNTAPGNVAVGGGFGFTHTEFSGGTFYINPVAEYFVWENVSVGGTLQLSIGRDYRYYGIGPSISYYFWRSENWVALVGGQLEYTRSENVSSGSASDSVYANLKLGALNFLTPSVAFGPELLLESRIAPSSSSSNNFLSLRFQLAVFL